MEKSMKSKQVDSVDQLHGTMSLNILFSLLLGVVLRGWLIFVPQIKLFISSLPEVSTPVTSWNRVIEGLSLMKSGKSIHDGDSYHGSVMTLLFANYLQSCSKVVENAIFILCDVISGIALYQFSKKFLEEELKDQLNNLTTFAGDIKSILLNKKQVDKLPMVIFGLYLINPFTISTCISKSTLTFTNMFISLFFHEAVNGNVLTMSLFLAVSTYESFYPVMLIIPAVFCLHRYQKSDMSLSTCALLTMFCSLFWLFILFFVAYLQENSFQSLFQHFKFLLTVPDQTPNVGLFWYFFTEIFNHFHSFFLFVFQLNVFVFAIPLSIKLRSHPIHLAFIMIGTICILKSYPSFGDTGLWLSMLPLWAHTFRYLRIHVVSSVMLITTSILCPVMWHMWIYARSANANFFFAATLAYSTAQVLTLTDVTLSYLKWHYHLKNGLEPLVPGSNEKALIRLQM